MTLVMELTTITPWKHLAFFSQNLHFFLPGHFYLIPRVLSVVSFFLGFPLLFSSFLAFSSLHLACLCKQDCFHRCRKRPLSLVGFSELAFCFDRRILSDGTVRDFIMWKPQNVLDRTSGVIQLNLVTFQMLWAWEAKPLVKNPSESVTEARP